MPHPSQQKLQLADWFQLQVKLDWAYEGHIAPEYSHTSNHISGESALLIRKGEVVVRTASKCVCARKGQWLFPSAAPRTQDFSDDAEFLSIHFHSTWPSGQALFVYSDPVVFDAARYPRLETRAKPLVRWVSRIFPGVRTVLSKTSGTILDATLVQNLFTAWFHAYLSTFLDLGLIPTRSDGMDSRVLQAVQALDRLPLSATFDEKQFALELGLGMCQLNRIFSREFLLTPRRYFDRRKFDRAVSALHGPLPIKEIAFELGFCSLAHFSGWFRKKTGLSPRKFRQQPLRTKSAVRKPPAGY